MARTATLNDGLRAGVAVCTLSVLLGFGCASPRDGSLGESRPEPFGSMGRDQQLAAECFNRLCWLFHERRESEDYAHVRELLAVDDTTLLWPELQALREEFMRFCVTNRGYRQRKADLLKRQGGKTALQLAYALYHGLDRSKVGAAATGGGAIGTGIATIPGGIGAPVGGAIGGAIGAVVGYGAGVAKAWIEAEDALFGQYRKEWESCRQTFAAERDEMEKRLEACRHALIVGRAVPDIRLLSGERMGRLLSARREATLPERVEALRTYSRQFPCHLLLGDLVDALVASGDVSDARTLVDESYRLPPFVRDDLTTGLYHYRRGLVLLYDAEPRRAAAAFEQANVRLPADPNVLSLWLCARLAAAGRGLSKELVDDVQAFRARFPGAAADLLYCSLAWRRGKIGDACALVLSHLASHREELVAPESGRAFLALLLKFPPVVQSGEVRRRVLPRPELVYDRNWIEKDAVYLANGNVYPWPSGIRLATVIKGAAGGELRGETVLREPLMPGSKLEIARPASGEDTLSVELTLTCATLEEHYRFRTGPKAPGRAAPMER